MVISHDQREARALARYRLLEEILDPALGTDQRGRVFDRLVEEGLELPEGISRVSRSTLYRYWRAYSTGGFQALFPKARRDSGACRAIPEHILRRAVELRHTQKKRETRHLIKMLEQQFRAYTGRIRRSTLDRHLALAGASRRQLGVIELKVFKQFGAPRPNDLWTSDVMHAAAGLRVTVPAWSGAHKVYLISWIDDHSRYLPHSEWYLVERLPALEDCFKKATVAHGLPDRVYSDKGAIYEARIWGVALAELGCHKVRTRARAPEAHGKIEKLHQTARSFEREAIDAGLSTLGELNEAWWAYLKIMVHDRPHAETGELPSLRYQRLTDRRFPDVHRLTRLFLVREDRTVNVKFSTVSVRAVAFRVDPLLRGRRVQVRYDPYSLDRVYIWHRGREVQVAHPACADNLPAPPEPSAAEPTPVQRGEARAFLRGLVEEAAQRAREALPGLNLAAMADSSSAPYGWIPFTEQVSRALGRTFEEFTKAEREEALKLWRDHGPLNRQWVRAALTRAIASKGSRQHLAYYLDQIKLVHFDEAPGSGALESRAGGDPAVGPEGDSDA